MTIGAEGQLVDEVTVQLVADIEAGIRFFGEQVLPVLGDGGGAASVAADGGGVVDGVGVGVGRAEGDAVLHALAQTDGKGIEVGEGDGVFVVVKNVRNGGAKAAGRVDDVETRAFRAVVADVEDDVEREGALDGEVPDLDVGQAVVIVDGVVAFGLRCWGEAVGKGEGGQA